MQRVLVLDQYKILEIEESAYNNIYFVGDIHGMFHLLEDELVKVGFDKNKDLLIATGDLVDRGKNSIQSLDYLNEKWFVSVFGNHDYKFMNIPDNSYMGIFPPQEQFDREISNKDIIDLKKTFSDKLYAGIQVNLNSGEKIGVVHADVPSGETWSNFKCKISSGDLESIECAIWSRKVAKMCLLKINLDNNSLTEEDYNRFLIDNRMHEFNNNIKYGEIYSLDHLRNWIEETQRNSYVHDVKYIIHGHSIISRKDEIVRFANRIYIDSGAFLTESYRYQDRNGVIELYIPETDNDFGLTLLNLKNI